MISPTVARFEARGTGVLRLGNAVLATAPRRFARSFSVRVHRLAEIEAIIGHRHGTELPVDPASLNFLLATHLAATATDLYSWAAHWAPWTRPEPWIVEAVLEWAGEPKTMQAADDCAELLSVTLRERSSLKLTTIGACDVGRDAREAIAREKKRIRDREREAAKRAAAGALPRDVYRANALMSLKPWEKLGVSRRTWYRLGRPDPSIGTSSSRPITSPIIAREQLVPPALPPGEARPAEGPGVRGAVAPAYAAGGANVRAA